MAEANVRDLEAVETFLHQLRDFQERLGKQLEECRSEMHRATHWIDREVPEYWKEQERIAKRKWTEAQDILMRCRAVTRADDHPACTEHRKRVEKWTRRVALCERQLKFVKQAKLEWQHELQGLQLKVQHVTDIVEGRLPLARHHLDSLLEPLRKYANLQGGNASKGRQDSANSDPLPSEASPNPESNSDAPSR